MMQRQACTQQQARQSRTATTRRELVFASEERTLDGRIVKRVTSVIFEM
jgi:hypothetical protein